MVLCKVCQLAWMICINCIPNPNLLDLLLPASNLSFVCTALFADPTGQSAQCYICNEICLLTWMICIDFSLTCCCVPEIWLTHIVICFSTDLLAAFKAGLLIRISADASAASSLAFN
jgi:hypothetical protein